MFSIENRKREAERRAKDTRRFEASIRSMVAHKRDQSQAFSSAIETAYSRAKDTARAQVQIDLESGTTPRGASPEYQVALNQARRHQDSDDRKLAGLTVRAAAARLAVELFEADVQQLRASSAAEREAEMQAYRPATADELDGQRAAEKLRSARLERESLEAALAEFESE